MNYLPNTTVVYFNYVTNKAYKLQNLITCVGTWPNALFQFVSQ